MIKHFNISAIQVPIVYNKYGDVDPDGLMYILDENKCRVKQLVCANPHTFVNLVQPLVIRVHKDDVVQIKFTNELCFPASINVKGLSYEVQNADGAFVGDNPSTLANPGETVCYRWKANVQGAFQFSDLGNPLSSEIGSNVHGLFGAIVVEAPGSTWTDPETGCPLESGVFADVHHPFMPDFREFVTIFHDEAPVKNRFLEPAIDPMTGLPGMTHSINYRAEPMRNRHNLILEGLVCPGCEGEEVHHDSWVYGDPPPTILPRAYVGDPVRWYAIHGGMQETHIFHLHLHQWLFEKNDNESFLNDSRAMSPGQTITFDVLYGAGSLQRSYGDVIYHCHLYPHFAEGMWGIFRIHDVLEQGKRCYPDGTPVTELKPLPDLVPPPKPTPDRPGFPFFIPGKVGCRSPVPPIGWGREQPITQLEINALAPNAELGALFVNPCPPNAKCVHYDIVAIQMDLVYNTAGWHDPQGRLYVLAEDEEDVRCGRKKPEPLFIRARAGECIEIHFTNKLPEELGNDAFQGLIRTLYASTHVHFVKFDVLSSDGANTGWNYFTGAECGQTVIFRWFADVELKVCFFHDHLFANMQQLRGLFGGMIIEPEGSTFRDPFTGKPAIAGTQMMIENPFIPSFREFCLAVHDFAPVLTADGIALEPPPQPDVMDDMGVMGFNYTNEPFQIRGGDPAYVFSSYVHGDPYTPVFQGYAGDPVRVRLIDGAHEESHAINFNRYPWHKERTDTDSPFVQTQHIGISETFTFEFALESISGEQDFDVLYYSGGMDDFWLGLWGLMRVRGTAVPFLKKLDDRPALKNRIMPLPCITGRPPCQAMTPGDPYPEGAKVNRYHIAAVQVPILYNKFGDHDPFGMVFVPYEIADKVMCGEINPDPLMITVNTGEGLEITLTNLMPKKLDVPQFPEVPVQQPWPYSPRVSMHSQFAIYDVLGSDGTTVGFNPDQTIGVGESITYKWYYPQGMQQALLLDFGDVMNHRKHGLFGAVSIAESGSEHTDIFTGCESHIGEQLTISNPFVPDYRQFIVMPHNGIYLENINGELLPEFFYNPEEDMGAEAEGEEAEPAEGSEPTAFDTEDQGMKGYNLRSEPFFNRLAVRECLGQVFSSQDVFCNDPLTPVYYAHAHDPVTIKLLMPADKPRATTFNLHAHAHYAQSEDLFSDIIGLEGAITIGTNHKQDLLDGAGGKVGEAGDYMYQSGNIIWDLEQGMWGIMRVLDEDDEQIKPLEH